MDFSSSEDEDLPLTPAIRTSTKAVKFRSERPIRKHHRKYSPKHTKLILNMNGELYLMTTKDYRLETIARKIISIWQKKQQTNDPWGDTTALSLLSSYRFDCNNVNGICYNKAGGDLHCICDHSDTINTNVVCIQETKLDTKITQVWNLLKCMVHDFWKRADIVTASSNTKTSSTCKLGGTMTLTHSEMSNKITNLYSNWMGRWTATTYSCQHGQSLTVISCYQVCTNKVDSKKLATVYRQQLYMLHQEKQTPEPRSLQEWP